ncbi:uncharacterized protein LOC132173025 [Corylus avellana]|uniref:uncharacterized protein LOC132173025 n=1 Tax=Corylus avellana TaxID=13451 RepID=UPI00286CE6B8|nr:uncharacterized protein LOC132173025 [Corylus avellana]
MEEGAFNNPLEELEQIVSEEPSTSNRRERTLEEYRTLGGPLLHAAVKGDWPAAKAFLEKYPDCARAPITKQQGTALNNAVVAQRTTFTKELLKWMTQKDMEIRNIKGATALHYAAQSGIVEIAEQLVKVNSKPLLIHDYEENIPLHIAACQGNTNMVSYLFSMTPFEHLTANDRIRLLLDTIYNDMYDIALKILAMDPEISTADNACGWKALEMLARKPFAICRESQLSFWKSRLNSCLFAYNPNFLNCRDIFDIS